MKYFIHMPMKMEPIVSSETSAIRTQTPGNYPKRNKLLLQSCFIAFLVNRYIDRLVLILRQLILIPNRINNFMDLRANSNPCFNRFCWQLINTWEFVSFWVSNGHLKLKGTRLRYQWLCCVYFSLTLFNSWEKWFLHLVKLLCQSPTKTPFSFFTTVYLGW